MITGPLERTGALSFSFSRLGRIVASILALAMLLLVAEAAVSASADAAVGDPVTDTGPGCGVGANDLPNIAVRLRGSTGDELVTLVVDDVDGLAEPVTVPVSTSFEVHAFDINGAGFANGIRVEFSNDEYRRAEGYDRNITVDWIEVCGQRFQSDAPTTESFGTYANGSCQEVRYGASEILNCNGYFDYGSDPAGPSMVDVVVTARGTTGEEILDIRNPLGEIVASFNLTTSLADYSFEVPRSSRASDFNLEFNNDKYIPDVIDRNMIIEKINFDGREISTLDPRTFITGHYTDGGCQFGNNFYLGTTIVHCEGSFRFESAPTNVGQN